MTKKAIVLGMYGGNFHVFEKGTEITELEGSLTGSTGTRQLFRGISKNTGSVITQYLLPQEYEYINEEPERKLGEKARVNKNATGDTNIILFKHGEIVTYVGRGSNVHHDIPSYIMQDSHGTTQLLRPAQLTWLSDEVEPEPVESGHYMTSDGDTVEVFEKCTLKFVAKFASADDAVAFIRMKKEETQ